MAYTFGVVFCLFSHLCTWGHYLLCSADHHFSQACILNTIPLHCSSPCPFIAGCLLSQCSDNCASTNHLISSRTPSFFVNIRNIFPGVIFEVIAITMFQFITSTSFMRNCRNNFWTCFPRDSWKSRGRKGVRQIINISWLFFTFSSLYLLAH